MDKKEFYYQIKGRSNDKDDYFRWQFPPLFSGKIEAYNKKEAKSIIDKEYNKEFPQRVLKKDLESNEFLLKIQEIKEDDKYIKRLFQNSICEECKNEFKIIDLYNEGLFAGQGGRFCSRDCYNKFRIKEYSEIQESIINPKCPNVIYRIYNKKNNKSYIGQTTRSFTLRWWEHFCNWIPNENICDFLFETIEIVKNIDLLNEREQFYIKKYDSINNGYNIIKAKVI